MIKLTNEEKHLIIELRGLDHGEVVVKKQNFRIVAGQTMKRWTKEEIAGSARKMEKNKNNA